MKPRAVVVGLGSYFEKLRVGIKRYLNIVRLTDIKSLGDLNLHKDEAAYFQQMNSDPRKVLATEEVDCVLVLSPPATHLNYFLSFAPLGVPILVEKPLVPNTKELSTILGSVKQNPMLYCSDFYADVRAFSLLQWCHDPGSLDGRLKLRILDSHTLWAKGTSDLGPITLIEGKLREGASYLDELQRRTWLLDPKQGGVLLDLMYHYFALSSRLLRQSLRPTAAILKTGASNSDLRRWKVDSPCAETYAYVEGESETGVPFKFEVSKYVGEKTERWFKVHWTETTATMTFEQENRLLIEMRNKKCAAHLAEDYYEATVKLFAEYVKEGRGASHGLRDAAVSVEAVEAVKRMV